MKKRPFSLKDDPKHISGLLRDWLAYERSGKEILSQMMRRSWDELMGPMVARRTGKVFVEDKVLIVEILSPVLRNELLTMRNEIVQRLNEHLGEDSITQVVFR